MPKALGSLSHMRLELMAEMKLIVKAQVKGDGPQPFVTISQAVFGGVEAESQKVPHRRQADGAFEQPDEIRFVVTQNALAGR